MSGGKLLVFIPTYNERDNVVGLYENLRSLDLDLDILFIDITVSSFRSNSVGLINSFIKIPL